MNKTEWLRSLKKFCKDYSINIEHLADILADPKVVPMIRGTAFEFTVKDKLMTLLPEYEVSRPFHNPQSGTEKQDVLIRCGKDGTVIRVECKMASKGEFSFIKKRELYRIRVKCMRSRTLGNEAAKQIAKTSGRKADEHLIHNDQYLPSDFHIVATTIENAFYDTSEDGRYQWNPSKEAIEFLRKLKVDEPEQAFGKIYVALSEKLAATEANEVMCSRKECNNKKGCGFIPNYPEMFFDTNGSVKPPWFPIEEIETLLKQIRQKPFSSPLAGEDGDTPSAE